MNEHEKRMCLGLEGEALDEAIETALNKTKQDVRKFAGQVDQFGLDSRRKDDKARKQWIKERIAQAQEAEADEFASQIEQFEEEARRKDDKQGRLP